MFWKYINFQRKKNFKKNYQSYKHYLFNNFEEIQDWFFFFNSDKCQMLWKYYLLLF